MGAARTGRVVGAGVGALLVLVCGTGCGGGSPQYDERAAALQQARDRWNQAAIKDYDWTFRADPCECSATGYSIRVRAGAMSGEPYDPVRGAGVGPLTVAEDPPTFRVVPDLFAQIERSLDADELTVEYDAVTGAPKVMSIDPAKNTSDDEITWRVTAFTPTNQ